MTKAQYWQQHIIDWQKSGLTQAIYCVRNDIKANTLHYWRKKLSPPVQKTNKLIPLRVHSSASARILLGSQVAIELPVESIADLLLALREKGVLNAAP